MVYRRVSPHLVNQLLEGDCTTLLKCFELVAGVQHLLLRVSMVKLH
jgi:hypothetical protein